MNCAPEITSRSNGGETKNSLMAGGMAWLATWKRAIGTRFTAVVMKVTLWCWSSTSTARDRGGGQRRLAEQNIGRKGTRAMGSMEEYENLTATTKFLRGGSTGLLICWNR
nr:hypothetical protein Iba_scaffold1536CG0620 [Ipomoea batatas]GME04294.1 hypothetical protein Iba_scaffold1866CG0190 [Ipomoea batatas]